MTSIDIRAQDDTPRAGTVWIEAYDGQTHYGTVLKALMPAFFILATAAVLLLAIL